MGLWATYVGNHDARRDGETVSGLDDLDPLCRRQVVLAKRLRMALVELSIVKKDLVFKARAHIYTW